MKRILTVVLILFIVACQQKTTEPTDSGITEQPATISDQSTMTDSVEADIAEIDDLDSELDMGDLDSIDTDLDEINW